MHFYSHHISDFINATHFMEDEEIIIYLRLIWIYYDTERPLSDDIEMLAYKTKSTKNPALLDRVLRTFFKKDGNVWTNSRCDLEIAQFRAKNASAKASAEKRWKKSCQGEKNDENSGCERNANAMRTQCERNADDLHPDCNRNAKPITNNKDKKEEPKKEEKKVPEPSSEERPCSSSPGGDSPPPRGDGFLLPDFVNPELWAEWLCHLAALRNGKAPTLPAKRRMLSRLVELQQAGEVPNVLIDLAIRKGWQDFYQSNQPQDDKGAGNGQSRRINGGGTNGGGTNGGGTSGRHSGARPSAVERVFAANGIPMPTPPPPAITTDGGEDIDWDKDIARGI